MNNQSTQQLNQTSDAALTKKRRTRIVEKVLTIILVCAILALAIALVFKWFVVSRVVVNGESMMPTYSTKAHVWVDKVKTPNRGDVIVLYRNYVEDKIAAEFARGADIQKGGKYERWIKRVVAMGGDQLWLEYDGDYCTLVIKTSDGTYIREDNIYKANGKPAQFYTDISLENTSTLPIMLASAAGRLAGKTEEDPFVVRDGWFFVLGDNRFNSYDSRMIGAIRPTQVYGVVI